MSTSKSAGAATLPRLFSPADARKILRQGVGKPSGVILEAGGLQFDLVPLTTEQGERVFELIDVIAAAIEKGDDLPRPEFIRLIAERGRECTQLLRDVLFAAVQSTLRSDEDKEVFEAFVAALPLVETIRAAIPKILEASNLTSLIARPTMSESEAPAP